MRSPTESDTFMRDYRQAYTLTEYTKAGDCSKRGMKLQKKTIGARPAMTITGHATVQHIQLAQRMPQDLVSVNSL